MLHVDLAGIVSYINMRNIKKVGLSRQRKRRLQKRCGFKTKKLNSTGGRGVHASLRRNRGGKKAAAWLAGWGKNYSDVFSELPQWKRNAHASNFIKNKNTMGSGMHTLRISQKNKKVGSSNRGCSISKRMLSKQTWKRTKAECTRFEVHKIKQKSGLE